MATNSQRVSEVNAVGTSLNIINTLHELDGATLTNIANRLSIPKSTVYTHLKTLEEREYIIRYGNRYRLGLRFLDHGIHTRAHIDLFKIASPIIEHLAEETEQAVWVAVEEYGKAVYIDKALGERAVPSRGRIGGRVPMHSAAIGKAILAYLPTERREEIIHRHGLPKRTEQTVIDREELFEELEEVQEIGVAFNDGESMEGLRAVASPVFHDTEICGALAVVGTKNRMKGEYFRETIPDQIKDAANEMELNLTYGD